MIELTFDSSSWKYRPNNVLNLEIVSRILESLTARCEVLGYVYLSDVYEELGLAWDPNRNNECFRRFSAYYYPYDNDGKPFISINAFVS